MQVTDGRGTCARVENPSDREVCFFCCAGDVMAACTCVRVRQEGVIPCRMVPSIRDEVHVRLHDVTGKVQHARLIIAAQVRELRVAVLDAQLNLKRINLVEKSKPRFRVNMDFPGQG